MDDMRRRTLRLLGIGIVTTASLQLSSALAAETGGAFKTAMGPVSAPMKPGGPAANSAATTGTPPQSAHPNLHKGSKHRHARSAGPAR
jgi:hypothetical protein